MTKEFKPGDKLEIPTGIDPGYPGLDPFTTGPWDPFYRDGVSVDHDEDFQALKDGKPKSTNLKVAGRFVAGATATMARGAYAVIMGIPYIVIGALGGIVRWEQLWQRNKNREKSETTLQEKSDQENVWKNN